MVRPMPIIHARESFSSPVLLGIGLFVTVSLLVSLCAKHSRKYTSKTSDSNTAKAPFPSPKQLIAAISQKAIAVNGKKSSTEGKGDEESGVWQKAILMGEKCQPPEFSGVILYDYSGNRVPEMPKSPRTTHMSPLRSFNFPKNENSMY